MSKTGTSLLLFISGLLTGSMFGILFAPDAGTNTRDKVTFRLERYKRSLEDLMSDLVRSKEQLPDSAAKSDGEKVINEAREKAKRLLDDVDNLLNQIKK